jgi:transcriptional regulator with XRE-family HTH domain
VAARSPTVRRRRLGIELRRLREEASLTIDQVAARLECSDSKISRIETGQVSATPRDVRDMLDIYEVGNEQRAELMQIAREARQKGWWHAYGDVPVPPAVAFEAEAFSMSIYQSLVVPGLLQTMDYARAVLRATRPELALDQIERRVELRMARQSILTRDQPPALWVVLDEPVLRRLIGGPEVMRQQLERLSEVGALPNVTLQLLPFTSGEHAGLDGEFTLIGFPDPGDPNVVYIEMPSNDLWLEDAASVRQYDHLFDLLRAAALSPAESAALITRAAKELH